MPSENADFAHVVVGKGNIFRSTQYPTQSPDTDAHTRQSLLPPSCLNPDSCGTGFHNKPAVLTGSFQVPQVLTATVKPIYLHQKHHVSILLFKSLFLCLQGFTNGSLHCSLELQIPWSIYAVNSKC